ncbi:hypothetical protein CMO84_07000 [Candidatus Woesearchaeota archaeon]|nr:hypothetical protein [Candidatus Woesearchaeota archaeon]
MSAPPEDRPGAVSAVICNYQGREYLPACLDALGACDLAEVIVVDNASTDGSLEWLREHHPEVRILEMGENAGPARARNAGLRAAQTPWVLSLDNDAIVTPGMLERLCEVARSRPEAKVLAPRSVFHAEPDRVHYDGGSVHYAGLISLRNFYRPQDQALGSDVEEVDVFVSVCVLCDRETLLEMGGYDERYFILFEDLDLSLRLRQAGHTLLAVEDAIVRHDAGTPGVSFREGTDYPARRVFYHSRNRWLFMLKTYRWWTLFVCLPGLAVYEVVWFGFALLKGGLGSWLKGKWAVLSTLPETLRMRRDVQARRQVGDRALMVGGPLTVTPALGQGGPSAWLVGVVDALLRGVWAVVRPLVR